MNIFNLILFTFSEKKLNGNIAFYDNLNKLYR